MGRLYEHGYVGTTSLLRLAPGGDHEERVRVPRDHVTLTLREVVRPDACLNDVDAESARVIERTDHAVREGMEVARSQGTTLT